MSRVDFYFIAKAPPQAQLLFACRLLEKAYQQEHQIYVQAENREQAALLDQLLWTFRDDSFIPHQLYDEKSGLSPIQIGYQAAPNTEAKILLNLCSELLSFHGQFNRILEIFPSEAKGQELAQKHRAFYEEKSYTIYSHQLAQ